MEAAILDKFQLDYCYSTVENKICFIKEKKLKKNNAASFLVYILVAKQNIYVLIKTNKRNRRQREISEFHLYIRDVL
jgi:hypothetical protein